MTEVPPLSFRRALPEDVDTAVPLMFSSGMKQYRYVFSVTHADQAIEFLRYAYLKTKGQFSHRQHTVLLKEGRVKGVAGLSTHALEWSFFLSAVVCIFSFYGFFRGVAVAIRGMRIEGILKPAAKGASLIYDLAVVETEQSTGLGRALVSELVSQTEALGQSRCSLYVQEDNPRAKALYTRLGFRVIRHVQSTLKGKYSSVLAHDYMERPV